MNLGIVQNHLGPFESILVKCEIVDCSSQLGFAAHVKIKSVITLAQSTLMEWWALQNQFR